MPTGTDFADSARQQAQSILSRPPYTSAGGSKRSSPRPLAGVEHAIGHALSDVFGPLWRWIVRSVFHPIGQGFHSLFGGWAPLVGILLAVAVGGFLAVLIISRRARIKSHAVERVGDVDALDPAVWEREADRLAAEGDFSGAVRARFIAGIMALEVAGLVADSAALTAGELTERLGSPSFVHLADRHELVAYAGDPAGPVDDADARRTWPFVPDEVRSERRAPRAMEVHR